MKSLLTILVTASLAGATFADEKEEPPVHFRRVL
ncbi:MAG: hypothetical protein ACI8UO_006413, partial [Verrucomicrobiales bacterium]